MTTSRTDGGVPDGVPALSIVGASVRGPAHAWAGAPNQDAWMRARGAFGALVVVCDGMGSRPQSELGSRMACRAVLDAVRYWIHTGSRSEGGLAYLIELMWRMRIDPHPPDACATTCLLALRKREGDWLMGGIGDGLLVTRSGSGSLDWVRGGERSGFLNETCAMGLNGSQRQWRFQRFPAGDPRTVLLATDGVSDDLLPARMEAFLTWMLHSVRTQSPQRRWRNLRRSLENWPTPGSGDDRTLAILWDEEENRNETR